MGDFQSNIIFMSLWSTFRDLFPSIFHSHFRYLHNKLMNYFAPYIEITFDEYPDEVELNRNEAYAAIESYLSSMSTEQASCVKGEFFNESESLMLTIDNQEVVNDVYDGIDLEWTANYDTPKETKSESQNQYQVFGAKRSFTLTFHPRHRNKVVDKYLKHVMEEGKAIQVKNRQRRLYTNNPGSSYWENDLWRHVVFDHPSQFETLAMDPKKKQEIIDDLVNFKNGKEYYAKVGRAWKRGYLLYGPPETGKSSMIAAIANFLGYNVYDIELTSVKNNTQLRKLLANISSKSVIVIEDIDCSLDLTGKRKAIKHSNDDDGNDGDDNHNDDDESDSDSDNEYGRYRGSTVTLSGLLNFIDGLWSAIGHERIIIFTTNYKEKLDPALIRRGRMDLHIEMSYCRFEAFKVLAKNYLNIESHDLFAKIGELLEEIDTTPADVAEHLMPKTNNSTDVDGILKSLIQAAEAKAKQAADKKK